MKLYDFDSICCASFCFCFGRRRRQRCFSVRWKTSKTWETFPSPLGVNFFFVLLAVENHQKTWSWFNKLRMDPIDDFVGGFESLAMNCCRRRQQWFLWAEVFWAKFPSNDRRDRTGELCRWSSRAHTSLWCRCNDTRRMCLSNSWCCLAGRDSIDFACTSTLDQLNSPCALLHQRGRIVSDEAHRDNRQRSLNAQGSGPSPNLQTLRLDGTAFHLAELCQQTSWQLFETKCTRHQPCNLRQDLERHTDDQNRKQSWDCIEPARNGDSRRRRN